ncbi:MAG: hypothetical protein AAB897_00455 [Patescibacteria group bacterium]
MKPLLKAKSNLDKKFKKVAATPASFAFFVAIHDFIECVELDPALSQGFSRLKINREKDLSTKYINLRQIHQGVKDLATPTSEDLGHDRNVVVRDLSRIRAQEMSDSNTFWKKRELWRKLATEVHGNINASLFPSPVETA